MNLYFTYESRDTPKSFALLITAVKISMELNLELSDKLKKKFKKLAIVVDVLKTTQNLFISHCCFAEDGKEMYKDL